MHNIECKNQSIPENQIVRECLEYINSHSLPELFTIRALTSRYSDYTIDLHFNDEGILNIIFIITNPIISKALRLKGLRASLTEHACARAHVDVIKNSISNPRSEILEYQKEGLLLCIESLYLILEIPHIVVEYIQNHTHLKSSLFTPPLNNQDDTRLSGDLVSIGRINTLIVCITICAVVIHIFEHYDIKSIFNKLFLNTKKNIIQRLQHNKKKVSTH